MAGLESGQCEILNAACSFGKACKVHPSFCPRMESHSKEFHCSKTQRGSKWQDQNRKTRSFSKLLALLNLNGIGLAVGILVRSLRSFKHSLKEQFVFGLLAPSNFVKIGSEKLHFQRSIFKGRLVIPSFCFIPATSPLFFQPVFGGSK